MEALSLIAITLGADDAPPREFRLFPKGRFKTLKGEFVFDAAAAAAVMARAAEWGNEFCLDYQHAMFAGATPSPAEAGRAAGWFKPEVRDGELWATDVRWTETAERYLRAREYRYISPTFDAAGPERRITQLLNCALHNIPATHGLRPLMAGQTPPDGTSAAAEHGDTMDKIALALGLGHELPEAEMLGRVALHREVTGELCKLTGKDHPREALGVLASWKLDAQELAATRAELEAARKDARQREVARVVDETVAARKLAPADREFAVRLGVENPEMFNSFIASRQPLVGAPGEFVALARPPSEPRGVDDAAEASSVGMSLEDYRARQAAMRKEGVLR